ncbi:hypothetical protein PMIN01_07005 [Paraphaeosphaeria minitans]|uniref:Uncharacterized protein n=1 Tax=Paraphaeosphaeria minitans TaxID=565426 RepID=A0A9P6GIH1_9PLEO|nr:hypothetical protein PMIN01_07005 [Paraphaeosphaeria minitans]
MGLGLVLALVLVLVLVLALALRVENNPTLRHVHRCPFDPSSASRKRLEQRQEARVERVARLWSRPGTAVQLHSTLGGSCGPSSVTASAEALESCACALPEESGNAEQLDTCAPDGSGGTVPRTCRRGPGNMSTRSRDMPTRCREHADEGPENMSTRSRGPENMSRRASPSHRTYPGRQASELCRGPCRWYHAARPQHDVLSLWRLDTSDPALLSTGLRLVAYGESSARVRRPSMAPSTYLPTHPAAEENAVADRVRAQYNGWIAKINPSALPAPSSFQSTPRSSSEDRQGPLALCADGCRSVGLPESAALGVGPVGRRRSFELVKLPAQRTLSVRWDGMSRRCQHMANSLGR